MTPEGAENVAVTGRYTMLQIFVTPSALLPQGLKGGVLQKLRCYTTPYLYYYYYLLHKKV